MSRFVSLYISGNWVNVFFFFRGMGIGNGWMSPLDQVFIIEICGKKRENWFVCFFVQGKYASYLFYHGLLDGEQYM